MTLTLRQARLTDRDAVVTFHRALYLEHRSEVMPDGMEELYAYRDFETVLREDVDAMLRNPATSILLALEDAQPVGYITGYISNDARRLLSRKGHRRRLVRGARGARSGHRKETLGGAPLDLLGRGMQHHRSTHLAFQRRSPPSL